MHSALYDQGFCKAAADTGVSPDVLIKVALNIDSRPIADILARIADGYRNLDTSAQRGILAGITGGLGTLALSKESPGSRLLRALAIGGLSGRGTYGLSRSGIWNQGIDQVKNNIDKLKFPKEKKVYRHGQIA